MRRADPEKEHGKDFGKKHTELNIRYCNYGNRQLLRGDSRGHIKQIAAKSVDMILGRPPI